MTTSKQEQTQVKCKHIWVLLDHWTDCSNTTIPNFIYNLSSWIKRPQFKMPMLTIQAKCVETLSFFYSLTQSNDTVVINSITWISHIIIKGLSSTKSKNCMANFRGEGLEDKCWLLKHFQVLLHHVNQYCCLFFRLFNSKWNHHMRDGSRRQTVQIQIVDRSVAVESLTEHHTTFLVNLLTCSDNNVKTKLFFFRHWGMTNSSRPKLLGPCCARGSHRVFQGHSRGAVGVREVWEHQHPLSHLSGLSRASPDETAQWNHLLSFGMWLKMHKYRGFGMVNRMQTWPWLSTCVSFLLGIACNLDTHSKLSRSADLCCTQQSGGLSLFFCQCPFLSFSLLENLLSVNEFEAVRHGPGQLIDDMIPASQNIFPFQFLLHSECKLSPLAALLVRFWASVHDSHVFWCLLWRHWHRNPLKVPSKQRHCNELEKACP